MMRGLLLVAVLTGCAPAAPPRAMPSADDDAALRAELLQIRQSDQSEREGFAQAIAAKDTAYAFGLMRADSARTRRLREIVERNGWPRVSRVGREAAQGAWLVLQHTPMHEFQREMLPRLEELAKAGEIPAADVAMLTDKVLVNQGKPQRYGSSFNLVNGRFIPHPIENLARVDELRAAAGLPPMAEYVKLLAEAYNTPVDWPPPSP